MASFMRALTLSDDHACSDLATGNGPGPTALMRSPYGPHSRARDFVSASTPAFPADECDTPGVPREAELLVSITAAPPVGASNSGSAQRRRTLNELKSVDLTTSWNCSGLIERAGRFTICAAACTSPVAGPPASPSMAAKVSATLA